MKTNSLGKSIFGIVLLIGIFIAAFSEEIDVVEAIDLRAVILVFLAPLATVLVFQKARIPWQLLFQRMRELRGKSTEKLCQELERETDQSTGSYGRSHVLKLTENHQDSTLNYAGSLLAARFEHQELDELLAEKIEQEDDAWLAAANLFGFLAKMAPYFGMVATVIGMVRLLQNMNDFSKISGGIAMAMQGTLFGLLSFAILYAPLQRLITDYRDEVLKRNQILARWILMVEQRMDPELIKRRLNLKSQLSQNIGGQQLSPEPGV